jgi:predicted dehydrogenase
MADQDRLRIYDKGVVTASNPAELHDMPLTYRYGGIYSPFIALQEPLSIQDQEFLDCARTGRRPSTDGRNGLTVVEVLEAAELSLRSGTPAHLDAVRSGRGNGKASRRTEQWV